MTFAEVSRQLAGQSALLFGWRPAEFWSATPAELAAIFAALGEARPAVLGRETLTTLMERNPDG